MYKGINGTDFWISAENKVNSVSNVKNDVESLHKLAPNFTGRFRVNPKGDENGNNLGIFNFPQRFGVKKTCEPNIFSV